MTDRCFKFVDYEHGTGWDKYAHQKELRSSFPSIEVALVPDVSAE